MPTGIGSVARAAAQARRGNISRKLRVELVLVLKRGDDRPADQAGCALQSGAARGTRSNSKLSSAGRNLGLALTLNLTI